MRATVLRQCRLRSGDTLQTAWLDDRPDLTVGVAVTLRDAPDPDRRWQVLAVGRAHDRRDINRGWSNDI